MYAWIPEARSLRRSLDGMVGAQKIKCVAWYSHGSPALRRSHRGQLRLPDRDRETGDEPLNMDTPAFLLGLSLLLPTLHPNSWDTLFHGSRARGHISTDRGQMRVSCQDKRPPTEAPLLKRVTRYPMVLGLERDAGKTTYSRLLMLDLSFGLLVAQWGIEVYLWCQDEKQGFETWQHLGFTSLAFLVLIETTVGSYVAVKMLQKCTLYTLPSFPNGNILEKLHIVSPSL